jgi:hypothetical protein
MYDIRWHQWRRVDWWLYDLQIGTKVRIGNKGALRFNVGVVDILGVSYLYDVYDWLTLNSALLMGKLMPSIGITFHPRISENILSHITFNVGGTVFPTRDFHTNTFPIAASFGFGIDGTIRMGE